MRNLSMMTFLLASLAASPAIAADAKINIISPADGSKLYANAQSQLTYEVTLGGGAEHAHLYVDGKMAGLLRQKRGSHTIDPLTPGMHEICAKLVDKNHTPTGTERCIKVTAE